MPSPGGRGRVWPVGWAAALPVLGQCPGRTAVGTRFVQLIIEHSVLGAVLDALEQEYEATRERLWGDLVALVADLHAEGLVLIHEQQA